MSDQSVFKNDIPSLKKTPGAYEWWYFDAISDDGETEFVIIFYEGNPFSRRYIQSQQNGKASTAEHFPAISISVYQNHKPVYYSFTEVDKRNATFARDVPEIEIGDHRLEVQRDQDLVIYCLKLNEVLPSGDFIEGTLKFKCENLNGILDLDQTNHQWHVMAPYAKVSGDLTWSDSNGKPITMNFTGAGYHDHNVGSEPLKDQFDEWYWGRFHFEDKTLIYYVTDEESQNEFGWLIGTDEQRIVQIFDSIALKDRHRTFFGLKTAKKIILGCDEGEVMIQQSRLMDNGPFYQRFNSDAFLSIPVQNLVQNCTGITEYLYPARIYNRLYWPLTNMRIRYKKEPPHWVQRSKMLYRWTW